MPGGLYVGSMEWAYDLKWLADNSIGAIWCVVDDRSKHLHQIERLQRELQEQWPRVYPGRLQPTILIGWSGHRRERDLDNALECIHAFISHGENVVFHCVSGVHRAGTAATLYL